MLFHKKCIIIGANRECVYSKTTVIKRLMVKTLNTGIIPVSNAPPCIKVNSAVEIIVAAIMLCFAFIIWYK